MKIEIELTPEQEARFVPVAAELGLTVGEMLVESNLWLQPDEAGEDAILEQRFAEAELGTAQWIDEADMDERVRSMLAR